MSDKITKTVTYEINPDGNCGKCWSGLKEHCPNPLSDDFQYFCMPFQTMLKSELKTYGMFSHRNYQQCQPCKDYLSDRKQFKEEQDSWNIDVPLGFMQSSEDRSE